MEKDRLSRKKGKTRFLEGLANMARGNAHIQLFGAGVSGTVEARPEDDRVIVTTTPETNSNGEATKS